MTHIRLADISPARIQQPSGFLRHTAVQAMCGAWWVHVYLQPSLEIIDPTDTRN